MFSPTDKPRAAARLIRIRGKGHALPRACVLKMADDVFEDRSPTGASSYREPWVDIYLFLLYLLKLGRWKGNFEAHRHPLLDLGGGGTFVVAPNTHENFLGWLGHAMRSRIKSSKPLYTACCHCSVGVTNHANFEKEDRSDGLYHGCAYFQRRRPQFIQYNHQHIYRRIYRISCTGSDIGRTLSTVLELPYDFSPWKRPCDELLVVQKVSFVLSSNK